MCAILLVVLLLAAAAVVVVMVAVLMAVVVRASAWLSVASASRELSATHTPSSFSPSSSSAIDSSSRHGISGCVVSVCGWRGRGCWCG